MRGWCFRGCVVSCGRPPARCIAALGGSHRSVVPDRLLAALCVDHPVPHPAYRDDGFRRHSVRHMVGSGYSAQCNNSFIRGVFARSALSPARRGGAKADPSRGSLNQPAPRRARVAGHCQPAADRGCPLLHTELRSSADSRACFAFRGGDTGWLDSQHGCSRYFR